LVVYEGTSNMKLSTRVQYGLRILCQLARTNSMNPLQLSEISAREGISEKYLGQIMLSLRSAGLVEATRGAQGGYYLSRSPASISVLELVTSIEGEVLGGIESETAEPSGGKDTRVAAGEAWIRLRSAMEASLSSLSLEDLIGISMANSAVGNFSI